MSARRLVISRGYYLVKTQIKLIIEIFFLDFFPLRNCRFFAQLMVWMAEL